jgi:hypothetical protein
MVVAVVEPPYNLRRPWQLLDLPFRNLAVWVPEKLFGGKSVRRFGKWK